MKRRVFKEKFTNKIMQDCNGEELEFPDVDANDSPEVGDKILLDGKKATGERLMPNGSVIKFKDGVITHIMEEPKDTKNLLKATAVKDGVCKTFNGWKDNQKQKVEILGNNASTPFRKGNRVLVNGKAMTAAKCEVAGKKVTILNGRISEVKSLNKSKGTRRVVKAKGKKVIGVPVKPKNKISSRQTKQKSSVSTERNEIMKKKKVRAMLALLKSHKMKFMKKLK